MQGELANVTIRLSKHVPGAETRITLLQTVDIEIDSGAEVSCLPANIGADTYSLHETRLSMCGGYHVAVGGGKLYELGARILGLEAASVRGDVVNLLVRFRVMNSGKAHVSTQDPSRCDWETVCTWV